MMEDHMKNLTTATPSTKRPSTLLPPSPPPWISSPSSPSWSRRRRKRTTAFAMFVLFGGTCFYLGVMVGFSVCRRRGASGFDLTTSKLSRGWAAPPIHPAAARAGVVTNVHHPQKMEPRLAGEGCHCDCDTVGKPEIGTVGMAPSATLPVNHSLETADQQKVFSAGSTAMDANSLITTSNLVAGAVHVKRNDFAVLVDAGVPIDPTDERMNDVLILYTSESSLPSDTTLSNGTAESSSTNATLSPAARAVENCLTMKVVFTEFEVDSNCIAVVGHPEESYHVHRFHRVRHPEGEDESRQGNGNVEVSRDAPLLPVPRTVETRGIVRDAALPSREELDQHMDELARYLRRLRETLDALMPIAEAVASSSKDGRTIVAIAVNHGQSELLINFVCSARSRNLDLSQVLVFATDSSTKNLASSLGLTAFDVRGAFGNIPTEAAETYGDEVFGRVVVSKIYCVHLLVLLGHNVLLQDADVVWRKHPLEYFTRSLVDGMDMIFQDDGSRQPRFAPFFANTGFYFVQSNDRTVYFTSTLVRMADVVGLYYSDQETISIFLSEHVSWKGLRVKVLGRDTQDGMLFPCGYHFHRDKAFMKKLIKGEIDPYVFHMNWTPNKVEKLKFLSQLGEWHVQPACANSAALEALGKPSVVGSAASACCSVAPIVKCYYCDLPSKVDCRNSPFYDSDHQHTFWWEPLHDVSSV